MGVSYYCICISWVCIFALIVHSSEQRSILLCNISDQTNIDRQSFPTGFIFGAGSSAYQFEGAAEDDGRGASIWDTFVRKYPEKIMDHSTGDVAVEFYYRYKEDIALMKEIGLDSFRFSISWPRILPHGKVSGGVNQQGVDFYNFVIDELLLNGIQPLVTLFHWDLPQTLEDEYGGFLSPKIIDDFGDYADFCFKEFGDRVKHWVTLNEPNLFAEYGYAKGTFAPGRCSSYMEENCSAGNSGTEPYLVAHHLILSHATAVQLYRNKYQASQNGIIGITIESYWMVPKYQTDASTKAALRALDFIFGWIMDPIMFGNYPMTMQSLVGQRLPKFTKEQSETIKGSIDFLGLNYYTAQYADEMTSHDIINLSYTTDSRVNETSEKNGIPIGPPTDVDWLCIYPKGIRKLLRYIKGKYSDIPPIYITENGIAENDYVSKPIKNVLNDCYRVDFHRRHLSYLLRAIKKDGMDIRGYYVWSFMDNFEWNSGYTCRMGFTFIDYKNGLKRYLKTSALWFKNFLNKETSLVV